MERAPRDGGAQLSVAVAMVAAVLISAVVPAAASGRELSTSSCTRLATRTALSSFVSAFNSGDYRRLQQLFAGAPAFRWYSSNRPGLRSAPVAMDRTTLIAYFRSRHQKRDRMRLATFTLTGANALGESNFVFTMKRSTLDFRGGAWFGFVGKGAAVCSDRAPASPQLVVVSLGAPGSDNP